ncbi:hypothetical protein LTR37_009950 [Vermiconidia calcicola]|uniref:Uncharacterized protein n=1 Tax=Vermiconidia calcicola TaxID=1690605 RepID=A0ACC3N6I2_9PEZI|nr:hypothetical protein LTR37_009950 [Vermiconidia calcicola]
MAGSREIFRKTQRHQVALASVKKWKQADRSMSQQWFPSCCRKSEVERSRASPNQRFYCCHRVKVPSRSELIRLENDPPMRSQAECSRKGQLVGIPEDELPILVQMEGRYDTLEFWIQQEARDELQRQMRTAVSDTVGTSIAPPSIPHRPVAPPPAKLSFFGRKQIKAPVTRNPPKPAEASVSVDVQLDELHFRRETEYGLYETLRGRCVLL